MNSKPTHPSSGHRCGLELRFCLLALTVLVGSTFASRAQADDEEAQRRYAPSRGDENWAWLSRPHQTSDFWDPLKYVRLADSSDDVFLSLGGETRQYLDGFHNALWGSTGHPYNGDWEQKYMLDAELRLTPYLRVFAQLKSGVDLGRLGGPQAPNQDALDVNQAYVDIDAVPGRTLEDRPDLAVRIGRQEMSYGSGRLVDVRDGPVNVRSSYDGVRILSRFSAVRADAFLTRPDLTVPGVFDDGWDPTQVFWGAWATVEEPAVLVDAYYLGLDRQHAVFEKGAGHELRHTVGARVVTRLADRRVSLEGEGVYQFGSFLQGVISAWMFTAMGVFRPTGVVLDPEIALGVGAASGDRGPRSTTLGTFNTLFPTGMYFGMIGMNGAPNHIAPRASLTLHLTETVAFRAEFFAFWRESTSDGVYNVPGFLLRPGAGNAGRYVGTQVEPYVTWDVDHHCSLNATAAYFWVGDFFGQSQPGSDVTFAAMWANYKF
jgi:hypothetical protein